MVRPIDVARVLAFLARDFRARLLRIRTQTLRLAGSEGGQKRREERFARTVE